MPTSSVSKLAAWRSHSLTISSLLTARPASRSDFATSVSRHGDSTASRPMRSLTFRRSLPNQMRRQTPKHAAANCSGCHAGCFQPPPFTRHAATAPPSAVTELGTIGGLRAQKNPERNPKHPRIHVYEKHPDHCIIELPSLRLLALQFWPTHHPSHGKYQGAVDWSGTIGGCRRRHARSRLGITLLGAGSGRL